MYYTSAAEQRIFNYIFKSQCHFVIKSFVSRATKRQRVCGVEMLLLHMLIWRRCHWHVRTLRTIRKRFNLCDFMCAMCFPRMCLNGVMERCNLIGEAAAAANYDELRDLIIAVNAARMPHPKRSTAQTYICDVLTYNVNNAHYSICLCACI